MACFDRVGHGLKTATVAHRNLFWPNSGGGAPPLAEGRRETVIGSAANDNGALSYLSDEF